MNFSQTTVYICTYASNYVYAQIIIIIILLSVITGVDPSEGSVYGGTLITVYVDYLDLFADTIEVIVGGK